MSTAAAAPIAGYSGFNCPFCGHWTKSESGNRAHMRACKVARMSGVDYRGHAVVIRCQRGNGRLEQVLTCPCGDEGVNLCRVADLEYLRAVLSLHRSTGASLLAVVDGEA